MIIKHIKEIQQLSDKLKIEGKKIVCVPTMGFLHEGHLSLIRIAKDLGDTVITTLFVNPMQFGPKEDFTNYPRDLQRDFELSKDAGNDYLFVPEATEMYPDSFNTTINIGGITEKFEGVSRPGHFVGVATVVLKLFNAVKPHIAVFGQKDYQQTLLIQKLVQDLNLDINIHIVPTIREDDGLAMSSRNIYLSYDERQKAGLIYKSLNQAKTAILNGERRRNVINGIMFDMLNNVNEITIDYCAAALAGSLEEPDIFQDNAAIVLLVALKLGTTRLIDNLIVNLNN